MRAEAEQAVVDLAVGQVDHRLAIAADTRQAIERRAAGHDFFEEPEPLERRLTRRLKRDAGTDRLRIVDSLEHRDGVTRAGEERGDGGAGGSRPDDADSKRLSVQHAPFYSQYSVPMKLSYVVLALLVSSSSVVAKGLTVDDMLAMQRVGPPVVSPDGKWLAF
jgi:hypothetical protein